MPQMYKVECEERQIVMIAPLDTIQRAFDLHLFAIHKIQAETNPSLKEESVLFPGPGKLFLGKWREIRISRLPLDIPLLSSGAKE